MIIQYLRGALADLQKLISYTKLDIEDIKCAKHNEIFARNVEKEALIKEFETKKALLDQEMRVLKDSQPESAIQDILDKDCIDLFGELKDTLSDLKRLNSDYARMVFAVGEFFTSLMGALVPQDTQAYDGYKKVSKKASINLLQVKA